MSRPSAILLAAWASVLVPATARSAAATPDDDALEAARVARADALLARRAFAEADVLLGSSYGAAALLVRARALSALGDRLGAEDALAVTAEDPLLGPLADVERALLALERGDTAEAAALVLPLVEAGDVVATPAVGPLAAALAKDDPPRFLAAYAGLKRLRRRDDPDARSRLLGLEAAALRALARTDEAQAVERTRYLEEPVSLATPPTPPGGITLTPADLLARAEILQSANRNERVVEALSALDDAELTPAERCQRSLGLGLAQRKLRAYERAEKELGRAAGLCKDDPERERRALYLRAMVTSNRDGLKAVPLFDAFVRRYPAHSMTDDVLFWAGDVFQRRDDLPRARRYYRRIAELGLEDDYCLEARWRLAWMDYRRGALADAASGLTAFLKSGCPTSGSDRARAYYWLGRIAQDSGKPASALEAYRQSLDADALGFYAQLALTRLGQISPEAARAATLPPPGEAAPIVVSEACAVSVAAEPSLGRARLLLTLGLRSDAARVLVAAAPPATEVVASTHAAAIGESARWSRPGGRPVDPRCDREARLQVALLLDQAGAFKEAAWRLRTERGVDLTAAPTAATLTLWRAAYPLAFRDELAAAEQEAGLPEFLLQALAREESAFDAQVVSWAGAYGLTQLLLTSGRDAGRLVSPKLTLARAEDLLEPGLNARLGGALLASLVRRYDGSLALALAGYNAGPDRALTWWKRLGSLGLDVLAEEIPIQETRGYVRRVLRSYGVYRWLYRGAVPALPIELGQTESAGKPPPPDITRQ